MINYRHRAMDRFWVPWLVPLARRRTRLVHDPIVAPYASQEQTRGVICPDKVLWLETILTSCCKKVRWLYILQGDI